MSVREGSVHALIMSRIGQQAGLLGMKDVVIVTGVRWLMTALDIGIAAEPIFFGSGCLSLTFLVSPSFMLAWRINSSLVEVCIKRYDILPTWGMQLLGTVTFFPIMISIYLPALWLWLIVLGDYI